MVNGMAESFVMRFYKTLAEKKKYFIKRNLEINTFDELLILLKQFEEKGKSYVLFRGQPDAKLMLYSSLQRLWIDRKLEKHYKSYRQLIDNLIANSKLWNSGLVSRYLRNAGWHETEMSVLSIMQHYGVPTPLLDFTYDVNKSLFFATQNIDFSPPVSEIEKYFSIYYIHKDNSVLSMSDMAIKEALSYARDNDLISVKELDATMQFNMALIDNADEAYRIQNNLNILNQEGAFIFNSSPVDPLEVHYYRYARQLRKALGRMNENYTSEIGGCININKKLTMEIRDFLKENGIDRYSMFPDLNDLRKDCLNLEWDKINSQV